MQDQAAQRFVERIGPLEPDSAPLYLQLKRLIQDAISTNLLRAGEALPPERDLADTLAISRVTVRKAFEGLVDAGLLDNPEWLGEQMPQIRSER